MSWRETLDQINPFDFMNAAPCAHATQIHSEGGLVEMQDPAGAATRFELDADAFMAAIEDPRPLFLQDCEDAIRELLRSSGEAA